jgi:hypothetical protein
MSAIDVVDGASSPDPAVFVNFLDFARSHRVLPQCSDSVAMGAMADVADARSKRRF